MSRLNISFLGTFQVLLEHQPITHFRSANNQGLLVYLALQSEKPISRETLMALFWPDESEGNARNNLRQALYQLRKLLGDLDEPDQLYLLVTRQTVQFNPNSDFELDVQQFLQAVDGGDLATAVTHYHGDLLPGFTCDSLEFETWLRQERESLHTLALETMLEAARDCLGNGRYDKAQTIARQQLVLEPWREQAHRQLMQAFVLAGDRGSALGQYETCREALAEELGVEPAEETVKLVEDIKAGRYGSAKSTDTILPPIKARHNLPADTTPLIGRELELARIRQFFMQDGQRLVTILGPGGMGKTRLGLAVGASLLEQFQDGVYFVDLAPLAQPDEIGLAIAAALNYQAPDNTQALFPQLLKTLSRQNVLLILDNFEHLLDGTVLVHEILQMCPAVTILVTSRQRLNLASESRFELGGLEFPDWLTPEDALDYTAVQLFVENGRRVQPDFSLTEENVNDIARICQLVQGMPLGLVLAASWLELLFPGEIAAEIEKSLDFLVAELTDLPPRQRSIQAVFDYSWQMITPAEQTVMAKLSVFRGGFSREAAAEVAGANLRLLLSLVNKSLLQRQAENGRFTVHELLRQYAATQRKRLDANDEALLAHCRYFAGLAKAEIRHTLHFFPLLLTQNYAADRDNFWRAWDCAMMRGLAQELSDLVRGIAMFNLWQGYLRRDLPVRAIQILREKGCPEDDEAMLHIKLMTQAVRMGGDNAYDIHDQLLSLEPTLQKNASPDLLFWFYERLSWNTWDTDGLEAARPWMEKAHATACEIEDDILIKTAEVILLWNRVYSDLVGENTVTQLEKLRSFFVPDFGNSFVSYFILEMLGKVHTNNEAYEQAVLCGKQCLNIAIQWQDLLWISRGFGGLANTYWQMGLQEQAKLQFLESLEWHLAIGQQWQTLGFLWSSVLYESQLIHDDETGVTILSIVYHHPENPPFYKQRIEEALPQFREKLGQAQVESAWEKGKELDLDTAVSLIRSALTSEGAA